MIVFVWTEIKICVCVYSRLRVDGALVTQSHVYEMAYFMLKFMLCFFFLQPCDGEMIILLHYHLKVGLRLLYVNLQLFEIRNRTLPKSMLIGLPPPMYFYPCLVLFIVVSVSFPSIL